MTGLCGLYFWNSYKDKMNEIKGKDGEEDIIENIMFDYVGSYQTGGVLIGLLISVFSHLHSISYNYYDGKKAQIADKSGKIEGMIISRNWHYYIDLLLIFEFNFSSFSLSNCKEKIIPITTPLTVAKKPIVKPVKKNDFLIEELLKPNVFNIAISLVLFLIKIVRPEIILKAATIIIRVKIRNITFLSTLRALKKDLFRSDQL